MCKDVLVVLPLVALTAKHEKERRGDEEDIGVEKRWGVDDRGKEKKVEDRRREKIKILKTKRGLE